MGLSKPINSEDVLLQGANQTQIHVGEEVFKLITDEKFLISWDSLYNSCPWATVFQSKEFTITWYKANSDKVIPILILSYENGKLTGLFALVKKRVHQKIFGAGIYENEYQTWLAGTYNSDQFIDNALQVLKSRFKKFELELKYIPQKAPLDWVNNNQKLKYKCLLRKRQRPLMLVNDEIILKNLNKKYRRKEINRLKRLGVLTFERISDLETFLFIFDTIAEQYDLRQTAKYNRTVFKSDAAKKQYYIELFKLKLLHVTVLKVNAEIIAANVGIVGRDWLHFKGINTLSPFYASYSPGILHLLMLGQYLSTEGYKVFDLTPGDDSYKDTIATTHDEVYELRVYSHHKSYFKNLIRKELYFNILRKFGTTPLIFEVQLNKKLQKLKANAKSLKHARLGNLKFILTKRENKAASPSVYRIDLKDVEEQLIYTVIKKNNLHDLLNYEQDGEVPKSEFLTNAMKNYEIGKSSYTVSEDNKLAVCAWFQVSEGEPAIPKGAMVINDIYCNRYYKKLTEFMISIVSKVLKEGNQDELYISTTKPELINALKSVCKNTALV